MIEKELITLEETLRKIGYPMSVYKEIESQIKIENLLLSQNLVINESLVSLYLWKGGLDGSKVYDGTFIDLFSYGNFIDIESVVSLYLLDQSTNKIYGKKLPIIQSLTDNVFIDLDENSSTIGRLYILAPAITLSNNFVSIYDSLESWIRTIRSCYEKKAYIYKNSDLDIDFHLEAEISKELNPNSEFWES
ncbi:hypothetical protein [Apibacter adventoris]|uniref:SMI1/KNR4 family protein n=1 Tax=Apibacter adventoris TaxID=1679466 RepID=A0A2S8A4G1_9FLAO|nr:hypothetical protein [Apibacter adventoris]PQL89453.1 hypothetical protein C4S77_12485 [Apibacter adventoris]